MSRARSLPAVDELCDAGAFRLTHAFFAAAVTNACLSLATPLLFYVCLAATSSPKDFCLYLAASAGCLVLFAFAVVLRKRRVSRRVWEANCGTGVRTALPASTRLD